MERLFYGFLLHLQLSIITKFMKIEAQILNLKSELNDLSSKNEAIEGYLNNLETLSETLYEIEKSWIGSWGSESFDYYKNTDGETIRINAKYINEFIDEATNLNLNSIEENTTSIIKIYQAYKEKVITELSIIKGVENLKSEIELLDRLENYGWGISSRDFIKRKMPKSIYTSNPSQILNRGLDTPPHLIVQGRLNEIATSLISVMEFNKSTIRLFRQLELKLSIEDYSPTSGDLIIKLINRFHIIVRQMLHRHSNRNTIEINDEYDVQDLFHALLRIDFEDVRAEEYTPSYAGSATRMDFLLKKEKIVVEVKKTRNSLKDKEVGEQLIIDIQHYKVHPDCKRLICFVYYPDNKIKNPRGLESDLNELSTDQLIVETFIRP